MKSTYRWTVLAAVLATTAAFPATAQAQCAGGAAPVGNLGIAMVECDCVVDAPTSGTEWRFWTQPKVLRLERGGPADGVLRPNDVIVSVDGQAITSPEGARALARPVPSRGVSLTIRRNGELQSVTVNPTAACPNDPRLLGVSHPVQSRSVPTAAGTVPRGVRVVEGRRAPVVSGAPTVSGAREVRLRAATAASSEARTVTTRAGTPLPVPSQRAVALLPTMAQNSTWIGLAFNCEDCTVARADGETRWHFGSPPEVYSVEQGSPAYKAGIRRGDVLTHVDGHAITSTDGGRRWASLKPGDAARVTYRRDGQSRSVTLRPVEPPSRAAEAVQMNALRASVATSDAATERLVREYHATVTQQQERQEELLRRLMQSERGSAREQQELERIVSEYAARDSTLRRAQQQQLEALLRQREAQALTLEALTTSPSTAPSATVVRGLAPTSRTDAQRLRYSGTFGGSDIEVRGLESIVVTELGNELIITTRDATIRLKLRDREP